MTTSKHKERNNKEHKSIQLKTKIKKINKTKSLFSEKINKIDKPLARLTRRKADTNYQYQELNSSQHYRQQSQKDNK